MRLLQYRWSRSGRPKAGSRGGPGWARALLFGTAMLGAMPALGAGDAPGLTGATHPDDVVAARQLLMDGIDTEMQGIDRAVGGADLPLADLKERAYRINTMLTAFPHLFPPETKPSTSPDAPATNALPAVWEKFDSFYDENAAAASTAFDASQAKDLAQMRMLGKDLRAACDACHQTYMQVPQGPQ